MKPTKNYSGLSLTDLILVNGNVITVDPLFTIVQAVAIKDDKIVAAGSNEDVRALAGKQTRILDLKGATVLPGINDTHCHMSDWALTRPPFKLETRYPTVKSISDIVSMVQKQVKKARPGDWVLGEGWDQGYLKECQANPARKPSKEDLDKVAPNNPVYLVEYSGHRSWCNSLALKLVGITRNTPDMVGGIIEKDPATGEPTGLLYEKASFMVGTAIPPWSYQQRKTAIPMAMAELNSLGITSFTDAGVERNKVAIYNDAYNEFSREDRWTCRVNMLLSLGGMGPDPEDRSRNAVDSMKQSLKYIGTRHNFGNEWLRIVGVKLVADGIPPLKTAWMYDDYYLGGGTGSLTIDGKTPEEQEQNLRTLIILAHQNRYQVGIHCTGSRTADVCHDQYMKCIEEDPWDARHYTIHSDFVRLEMIEKVGKFGKRTGYELGMNIQSLIKWTISGLMDSVVGQERAGYEWPERTMLDNGIHVADSSDAPVTYPDWRNGIQSAVLRESKATGKVSGPEQCITVPEAIRNYTLNGAWFDHMETKKGSIEPGKFADLCIIDRDILSIDPHKINELKILMTIAGGQIAYDAGSI
jgi:predicted amidohydrolase YtcJ